MEMITDGRKTIIRLQRQCLRITNNVNGIRIGGIITDDKENFMDKKEFFVDLALFVMSYINGSDDTWMKDYKKGVKTAFKEENK